MTRRLLVLLAALALFAAACGGDSDDTDNAGDDGGSTASSDDDGGSSDDSGSDDSGDSSNDAGSDDSGDSGDDSGSDDSGADGPSSIDCDEVRTALERAGNSVELDPTTGSDDLEASWNESRAQLEALGREAPELSDDIDAALAGMDTLGAALAALDWDTQNMATDPEAALEFASLLTDSDVMGMTQALSNISVWVATACA